jgi:predicted RNase H-like HicB family nuclease
MKYKIAFYRSEEGITVSVPALPGCWSGGDTEEEARTSKMQFVNILQL